MKKIAYLFSATAMIALATLSSCKKDEETVDNNPEAPVVTSTMTTTNGGNTGTAIASLDVTTSTGTAKLRLDVTAGVNLDRIYIMKSQDNGALTPLSVSDITTSAGTFSGGSASYTLKVPGSTKAFVIDIPVSVRTSSSAVTDVYYIWITDGVGDFLKPTKNVELGPATLTLKYTAATVTPYSSATGIVLGDQSNASYGSMLVTSGQVSALATADYIDAPASSDLSLSALNAAGDTKTNGSGILWLISPSLRDGLGYAGCASCGAGGSAVAEPTTATGANITKISSYSGDFDAATGTVLSGLSVGSTNQVKITAVGDVFQFETSKGKKGLIKVTALTTSSATVSVKVLN